MAQNDRNAAGLGEVNTDPRFIYQDDANVIAYRLGMVEANLASMDQKFDKVIEGYPTHTTLSLILDPLRDDMKELKEKLSYEEREKAKHGQQIRYLTYAAIIGPLATFVIALLLNNGGRL